MSGVVGFDFGTRNCSIAVIRNRKLEVATNEVSMRSTPNCVGYTAKNRILGDAGKDQFIRNAQNTILGPKHLLGRKFDDPQLQSILPLLGACRWTKMPNGDIGITTNYGGNQCVFTAEQLCAASITKLRHVTEAFFGEGSIVKQAVVSCPGWWSHRQRKALYNSCQIAEVNPLRIINDLSAVAFNYGFYHPNDFDEKSQNIMFISMGNASFQCNVVEFTKPCCTVKAVAYDLSVSGAGIDQLLVEFFAERFNKKYGCQVQENKRAMLKLLMATEKTKKTLNTGPLAPINQDCLFEGNDLQDKITKEEYLDLLNNYGLDVKVIACMEKCLVNAGLTKDDLFSIEWVGSSTRIQSMRDAIAAWFARPISSTMNAEEATAQGCALLCARLSPTASTRAYDLVELNDRAVAINWFTLDDPSDTKVSQAVLFPAGYALPNQRARNSTFTRPGRKPIQIDVKYKDDEYIQPGSETICSCKIMNIPKKKHTKSEDAEVRVKFRADPSGTFVIAQADSLDEREEEIEVPVKKKEKGKKDAKKDDKDAEKKEGEPEKMKTEETEKKIRKVEVTTKLEMEIIVDELTDAQVQEFKKLEDDIKAAGLVILETLNAKNDLETYCYMVKDKIDGGWREHVQPSEKKILEERCDSTTMWLYGDGDDETKEVYDQRKNQILEVSGNVNSRFNEWNAMPAAVEQLSKCISYLKELQPSENYEHIPEEKMAEVSKHIQDAEEVLKDAQAKLALWKKDENAPVLSSDLLARKDNTFTNSMKIFSIPKPKPPPAEEKKEETEEGEQMDEEVPAENQPEVEKKDEVIDVD